MLSSRPRLDGRLRPGSHDVETGIDEGDVTQCGRGMGGGLHVRRGQSRADEAEIGLDTGHRAGIERNAERMQRRGAIRSRGDHLGQERVVGRRDLGAALDPPVDPDPRRPTDIGDPSRAGLKVACHVLGVDACLHRGTGGAGGTGTRQGVRIVVRDAQHELDEVHAPHFLGHGMLNLKAGIDLEEHRLAPVDVIDELDRAGGAVPHRPAELFAGPGDDVAHRIGEVGRRRLLDHLLVAALQAAVPVPENDDIALAVPDHLDLDVAGVADPPFKKHTGVAEVRLGQAGDAGEGSHKVVGTLAGLDADAPATAGGLEHDRIAERLGGRHRVFGVGQESGAPDQRHAGRRCRVAGGVLDPEQLQLLGRWPHEYEAGGLHPSREVSVFGEEPVTGVNGPGP